MTTEHEAEIAALKAANEALLDGHAKISVAFLAVRLGRLEDENRRLSRKVLMLEASLDKAREFLREEKRKTAKKLAAVDDAARERTAASEVELIARVERMELTIREQAENGSETEAKTETV